MKLLTSILTVSMLVIAGAAHAKVDVTDMTSVRSAAGREKTAETATGFRQVRRVGLGVVAAGEYGVAGTQLDLNFTNETSFHIGIGGGPGLQAVTTEIREYMEGQSFQPFLALGYAKWARYVSDGPITRTTPSLIYDKFLTDTEKASGKFSKDLLYPSVGLEYFQLTGTLAGWGMFVKISLLSDIGDFQFVPTGALGTSYYF